MKLDLSICLGIPILHFDCRSWTSQQRLTFRKNEPKPLSYQLLLKSVSPEVCPSQKSCIPTGEWSSPRLYQHLDKHRKNMNMFVEKRGAPSRQDSVWTAFKFWSKRGVSTLTTPLWPSMDVASPRCYIFLFLHRKKMHICRKPTFLKQYDVQHHWWTATKVTTSSSYVPFSRLSNSH